MVGLGVGVATTSSMLGAKVAVPGTFLDPVRLLTKTGTTEVSAGQFYVWCDQRLMEGLGASGHCALLPRLLASIDALVQAVDAHHTVYLCRLGRRWRGKNERVEKVTEQYAANQYDIVSNNPPNLIWPYS